MRIAYVYDAVHPWVTGGVEQRVWALASRLATDHDVHWFGLQYWDGPARIERDGVTLHGVAPSRPLYVHGRRSIREAFAFAARLVRPLSAAAPFDVLDCQAFPYVPAFAVALATARDPTGFVVTWHEVWDDYWYEYLGTAGAAGKLIERGVARLPDGHLAVSERTARDLRDIGVDEVAVSPNGVDPAAIAAVEPADRPVDVLYVGRLLPEKNVDVLVRAMADRPDRTCLVVGDGPERDRLERLATDLDAAVTFVGFLEEHAAVLALMARATVLVNPSTREGFGMTVLEALACGTPVVTVAHPRNAAGELVVDGETGYVVPPTPSAIASALDRVGTIASADCRAAAEPYVWDAIADRLLERYAEVTA